MGITAWQRQLLSTLTRLESGFERMEQRFERIEEGQREMRDDIRTLTRVVVRRFGHAGSASPQIGDHVLFHSSADRVLPAVVLGVEGDRLELEVFGTDMRGPERFAHAVRQGTAPGCWSYPA